MKVFVASSLLIMAVCVFGEQCLSDLDCINHQVTTCSGGSHVHCDDRINQCVCVTGPSEVTCTHREECYNLPNCRDRDVHCVDRTCRCIDN